MTKLVLVKVRVFMSVVILSALCGSLWCHIQVIRDETAMIVMTWCQIESVGLEGGRISNGPACLAYKSAKNGKHLDLAPLLKFYRDHPKYEASTQKANGWAGRRIDGS